MNAPARPLQVSERDAPEHIRDIYDDIKRTLRVSVRASESFEQLLPGLELNVVLCALDRKLADELACSPFPARAR